LPYLRQENQNKMTEEHKYNRFMDEIMKQTDKMCKNSDDHVLAATSMVYCARIIFEQFYGKEMAVNLIDSLGGSKVDFEKPTMH
jgi:hypothetical protein